MLGRSAATALLRRLAPALQIVSEDEHQAALSTEACFEDVR